MNSLDYPAMIEHALKYAYPPVSKKLHEAAYQAKGFTMKACIRMALQELLKAGWGLTPPHS